MKRIPLSLFCLALAPSVSQAATLTDLNLVLRLEKTGYDSITFFDSDENRLFSFDFLDSRDNVWGLPPIYTIAIGQDLPLVAEIHYWNGSPYEGIVTDCDFLIGCTEASGVIHRDSFYIGDGSGMSGDIDFVLEGGTKVGDEVNLYTFTGIYYWHYFEDGTYAEWSSDRQVFSVVRNNLDPVNPAVVPLPASLPVLLAGLGALGWVARRKKQAV